MAEKRFLVLFREMSPAAQLIASLLVTLLVFALIYPLFLLAGFLAGIDLTALRTVAGGGVAEPNAVKYLQAAQHISLFIVPVLAWSFLYEGTVTGYTGIKRYPRSDHIIIVILISLLLIPVNSYTGYLNSRLAMPDWLPGAAEWIVTREKTAMHLISELMRSDNITGLVINLIIIALLPAAGEELFFRGMLQKIFAGLIRSQHFAVLITAFIFSSLHFQFFGFLPRLILGVVYGYLFLWSGSVWLPAIAHFINNAIPVIFSYFYGWELVMETTTAVTSDMPAIPVVSIIIVVVLMLYCRKTLREDFTG
ncbi:MAG: CPBP family intramembrane glutamic endopeptidase [Bacteroidales bacterium]